MTTTERIIDFLDRYGIMWTWNYQHVDENGKKHFVDLKKYDYSYPEGQNGYRSPVNFKDNVSRVKVQSNYYRRHHQQIHSIAECNQWSVNILHDTSHGHLVIDIDHEQFFPEITQLLQYVPYYLSLRKKLPNFFVFSTRPQPNQTKIAYEDGAFDLLHGLWSSAPADAMVYNASSALSWDLESWLINYIPNTEIHRTTSPFIQPTILPVTPSKLSGIEDTIVYKLCQSHQEPIWSRTD